MGDIEKLAATVGSLRKASQEGHRYICSEIATAVFLAYQLPETDID